MSAHDHARDFFQRSQHDVEYWNEVVFGDFERPWKKQFDIWRSVARYPKTVVKACHSSGKSHVAGGRIVPWFLSTFYPSAVFTTAPTGRQVDHVLWGEIRRHWDRALVEIGGKVYDGKPKIFIDHDWYALGFTTRKRAQGEDLGTLFQGFHTLYVLFIIDEAAAVEPEVWDAAESVCTNPETSRILAIGNATDGNSEFARKFKTPAPDKPGGWAKHTINAFDTPNFTEGRIVNPKLLTPAWVEDKKITWGETSPMYQAKILAEFPEMGTDTLIPLKFIDLALERYKEYEAGDKTVLELAPNKGRTMGVDCARYGDDMSVGYGLEGPLLERVFRMALSGADERVGRIGSLIREKHFDRVNIEEDAYGGDDIDHLRAQGFQNIFGVTPSGRAEDQTEFYDRKTELAWQLRGRFVEAQDIALDCEDTGGQLSNYKFKYTVKSGYNVKKLEPKDDMKKRLGRSPDDGDAAIYTMANHDVLLGDESVTVSTGTSGGDW